jgi:excinuclease UvrABC nuclease subunit
VAQTEKKLGKEPEDMDVSELEELIAKVEKQMRASAAELNFEMAAELRDKMVLLKQNLDDARDTEHRVQRANRRDLKEQPRRTTKTYNKKKRYNRGGKA